MSSTYSSFKIKLIYFYQHLKWNGNEIKFGKGTVQNVGGLKLGKRENLFEKLLYLPAVEENPRFRHTTWRETSINLSNVSCDLYCPVGIRNISMHIKCYIAFSFVSLQSSSSETRDEGICYVLYIFLWFPIGKCNNVKLKSCDCS